MKPVMQEGTDDCLRACLASILELPLHEVVDTSPPPGEIEGQSSWSQWNLVNGWLRERGWALWRIDGDHLKMMHTMAGPRLWPNPPGPYIGSGESPRGGFHAVVMHLGEIVHDPHPKGGLPLSSIVMIEVLTRIDKAHDVCDDAGQR